MEKIFIAIVIICIIILLFAWRRMREGFALEESRTPAYIRNYYVKKLAQTLSEDPHNSAGEYVEFFVNQDPTRIIIGPSNCVFKYDHINEKTYTIKIKHGIYTGPELAEEMECTLNAADNGWWVTWDHMHNRFALGSYNFKYRRWYHPQSIYYDIGIKCTPENGLMKNMTDWMDSEVGSSIYVCYDTRGPNKIH